MSRSRKRPLRRFALVHRRSRFTPSTLFGESKTFRWSSDISVTRQLLRSSTSPFLGLLFPPDMMDLDPRHYENVAINDNDVRNIVLSYLVHNCFKETAESFIASNGMKQSADCLVDMHKRKSIFHFALEGNALEAIELTEQLAPDLLEENKDLHFDLLSLRFVDLISSRQCTEALEFAQAKLTPFGKVPKYVQKLEDFLALLAYEEPEKSPMFHLLTPEYRQNIADGLNRAILVERLIQQATVVRQCLHQELGKDGPPPFSLKDFLKG